MRSVAEDPAQLCPAARDIAEQSLLEVEHDADGVIERRDLHHRRGARVACRRWRPHAGPSRFPYSIVYIVQSDIVRVLALSAPPGRVSDSHTRPERDPPENEEP
jgi:hypothetical protein